MATKQETNKNTSNNMKCSLCAKLIKILKHKPEDKAELKCNECGDDNDPVVALCIDCELCLCKVCYEYHSKKHKTHDILSLGSVTKTLQPTEKVLYCPEHWKNELDYYCETCNKLLCIYCAMKKEHVEHTHELVEKMASKRRSMLAKIIAPVEEMSKKLCEAEDDIVSTQEKIKEQASEIDQEIDKCYVELLKILNECHKKLKEQLHDAVSQKEEALNKQLRDMKLVQDELVKLTKLNENLEKISDHQVLSTSKQDIENHIQKVSTRYKVLNTQPVEYDTLEFVPAKKCASLLGDLFTCAYPYTTEVVNLPVIAYCGCKVEFEIIAKDSKGKSCTKGGGQVSVELKSLTGHVTAGEVRDINDGSYMASFVAERVGKAKLSVSINGEQIKGSPYNIVVSKDYQAIDKPSKIVNDNGSMSSPEGVAFSKDGMWWAVADWDNHCVYIFDDKNQLVRKFGSNGINNGQFENPQAVAFDSCNHLYVADCNNHRVQKFDINGNYLLQFGSKGDNDGQLSCPYGIAVYHNEVYVADVGNERISVFGDQFCFTFGVDHLSYPCDVAISSNNQLLVADRDNNCICAFTLDGHYVGKFGTQGSDWGQLNSPFSLATDLNGFIIVADSCNHRVQIFDKDGNCIHCFGSKGIAAGQFDHPYGIAVSPNGSIYVSDCDNQRIQIFF